MTSESKRTQAVLCTCADAHAVLVTVSDLLSTDAAATRLLHLHTLSLMASLSFSVRERIKYRSGQLIFQGKEQTSERMLVKVQENTRRTVTDTDTYVDMYKNMTKVFDPQSLQQQQQACVCEREREQPEAKSASSGRDRSCGLTDQMRGNKSKEIRAPGTQAVYVDRWQRQTRQSSG